ncbi:protein kinase domain-containing protein [Aureispira anguillae]|uniref:Serine/threonine protein kinase n=1 Tax=Aureispira anguillae TaxID=2864201 RepID=A0A915YBH0_9BACT|nr:serine/threonine protein kinase [Aureispira anguillae]BDS10027.1 serine/threonine protein kinase [Aureispira anguillae]
MPKQFYIKAINQAIVIHDTPFASGGEGELFEVLAPAELKNTVAKIFHPSKRDAEKEAKINYLLKNPPSFEGSPTEHPIVWVKHILHNAKDEFVGFLMPKATGEKLEILTSPKLPKYLGKEWNRFKLGGNEALRLRLKVCYNLAAALRTIHATGKYVLVDLKPDNILIKSNGVVAIVDTDSIEVIKDGATLFPATVATPEYTPNEYYAGIQPGKVLINTSWDNFSLAVIYYRMLFGVHPYAATAKAPYNNINALGDKIKHGLFVHHPDLVNQFVVVPPPHRAFGKLDGQLRRLFLKTFVDGYENPEKRPSAEEWGQALLNNPLLLTNRPLPSKALKLEEINDKNWYVLALEKALREQNLQLPKEKSNKKATLPTHYTTQALLQEAMTYYKQAATAIWKVARYAGMVIMVVMTLFIVATIVGGAPFGDVVFALDSIWMVITFLPSLIIQIGGFGLLFLFAISPFLIATFRQFTGMAKDKTQAVRKNWIGSFSFTDAQKRKSLEELQYTLYNQRTKTKQRLREIKNELIVWSQIKTTKEKEFFKKNNQKIVESNQEISNQLKAEKRAIQVQDEKAKALMIEEANVIKKLRKSSQQQLEEHPVYSTIKGKTIHQKMAFLSNDQGTENSRIDAKSIWAELQQLEQQLKNSLQEIKDSYDKKHAVLLGDTSQYKIRIDDLVKGSVDNMRQKTRIDSQLMDKSFKRLLKSIKSLRLEVDSKESELEAINSEIKLLKDELRRYM